MSRFPSSSIDAKILLNCLGSPLESGGAMQLDPIRLICMMSHRGRRMVRFFATDAVLDGASCALSRLHFVFTLHDLD